MFGRKIELKIEDANKKTKLFSSEDGFTIEFSVGFGSKAVTTIKIYNVLPATVEMCKPVGKTYAKVELSAGYEEMTKLTIANILSVEEKQSGTDRILEIKAGEGQKFLQNTYVISTFTNVTVSQILKIIFKSNGITEYEINLTDDARVSTISFSGTLQTALNELCKVAKAVLTFRNGKLFFESNNCFGKRDESIILISRTSGLIESPEVKGNLIKAKSLLNGNLTVGTIFKLQYYTLSQGNVSVDCKIERGKHFGGNKVESFYTEMECKKI